MTNWIDTQIWRYSLPETTRMTCLEAVLAELGISHYLNDFIGEGFDSWDAILDITESDFDALSVKLGHRRKLQRKIANSAGLSPNRALAPHVRNLPSDGRRLEQQRTSGSKAEIEETSTRSHRGTKRRYRWHPKPDLNAPERPPSAYVLFSSKVRGELEGRNLSFTEIAKLVGNSWRSLSPVERGKYTDQAFYAKEKYNAELSEYKKTSQYREYTQYLEEFKARESTRHQGADCDLAKENKTRRKPVDSSPASKNQWPKYESRHFPVLISPVSQLSQQCLRVASIGDRPSGCTDPAVGESLYLTEALQDPRRMGQSLPKPPSSTSASASASSQCPSSSAFLIPHTPFEPTLHRTLLNPPI